MCLQREFKIYCNRYPSTTQEKAFTYRKKITSEGSSQTLCTQCAHTPPTAIYQSSRGSLVTNGIDSIIDNKKTFQIKFISFPKML